MCHTVICQFQLTIISVGQSHHPDIISILKNLPVGTITTFGFERCGKIFPPRKKFNPDQVGSKNFQMGDEILLLLQLTCSKLGKLNASKVIHPPKIAESHSTSKNEIF